LRGYFEAADNRLETPEDLAAPSLDSGGESTLTAVRLFAHGIGDSEVGIVK
jgi:hypothetical protein